MDFTRVQIVLASQSPYRKKQLEDLGLQVSARPSLVDESAWKRQIRDPSELAQTLAKLKTEAVAKIFAKPSAANSVLIIGGDQVAYYEGTLLDKPGTPQNAVKQLERLSGRWHELHSAVAVFWQGRTLAAIDVTRLKMRNLTKAEIENYVRRDQSWDCAGAYKFERGGVALMEEVVSQDPSAIMGLPIMKLNQLTTLATGLSLLQLAAAPTPPSTPME